ncbi:fimbrial biogenesis chaperone [Stenotrophomonas maltophilia group sp. CASM26]|uniref:fimbrial biogenesis chaperone n=1 Tax=Stenotrophomonas maltophilia group sp. CASM26 TaxID=3111514 RepID=UPI003BF805C2
MKAIFAALLLCFILPVGAMTVSPMSQALESTATTGSIRIQNDAKGKKRYQVVVDLMTVGPTGEKVLRPSNDLMFFPSSLIELDPGKVQTLRWKRSNLEAAHEQAYQIRITELPLDNTDAVSVGQGVNVPIPLRMINTWVFVPPGAQPSLNVRRKNGYLVFHNTGNATAPVSKVSYGGQSVPGTHFVLPGERLLLKVETSSAARVSFIGRGGVAQSLPVE